MGAILPPRINLKGVKTISADDLKSLDYDLILVTGYKASLVPILNLGINPDKVVLDRTVCIPLFTLEKYNKLRRSQLSILSMNCFAGLLYHRFSLPFLTPTINMFTSETGFLKFLSDPIKNVSAELKFLRTELNPSLKIDYPVYKIGETEWNMNHYSDANLAYRKWYERTFRINWFNLLVTMYTENPEVLAEFDKLPYAKKICFVSFKSDLDSAYYLDKEKYGMELWQIVNNVSTGKAIEYDMWNMLLYGKKTPLIIKK